MTPPVPSLEYVFSIRAEIAAPVSSGKGILGERLHIAITGGTVSGPRLNGAILPGGSDWPVIAPDGNSRIEAHYTILTDDNEPIYVHNVGMRVSSAEALARLRAGEPVAEGEVYMRAAPRFDAPDGKYQWLREALFVSTLAPSKGAVALDVYRVG